ADRAVDRHGPRPVLLAAAVAGFAIPLLYFLLPGLMALYAILAAMGIVAGLARTASLAALGGLPCTDRPGRWFAAQSALFGLAAFLGPIIGSLLYLPRSMAPMPLGLIACMGGVLLAALALPPSEARTRRASAAPERAGESREKTTALLMAIGGLTLGIGLLTAFYPILLVTTLGRQGPTIAVAYAVPGLAAFLGLAVSGRLSGHKPDLDRVALGLLLSAGSLFALGGCTKLWQFIAFGTLMGGGAALSLPASLALSAARARQGGGAFGAAGLAPGVGSVLGPLLGGLILQHYQGLEPALQAAAILGALACLPLTAIILREQFHWGTALSRMATGVFAASLLILLSACLSPSDDVESPGQDLYRFTDVAMGAIVNLTIEAPSQSAAALAARKTMTFMRTLQQDLDFRNLSGSVGRINRNAGLAWIRPTPRTFDLLSRALEYSRKSRGAFDPTIGALTTSPQYARLDTAGIQAKAGLVDYRLVLVDRPGHRVRLKEKGMALDLGGIAKGAIIDESVAFLRRLGIRSGIVEADGDFYCFGDRDWSVGIRHPINSAAFQTIRIREQGACASGDYSRPAAPTGNGRPDRQHHILDPTTLEPARRAIGVTVIAGSAEKADALASALFVMGPTEGRPFLAEHAPDSAAIWFLPDHSAVITDNFPR
ncbi:MAG: MFS transporter, partial [Pseudodesulfovibrio sp.]